MSPDCIAVPGVLRGCADAIDAKDAEITRLTRERDEARAELREMACIYAHGGRSTQRSDGLFACDQCGLVMRAADAAGEVGDA